MANITLTLTKADISNAIKNWVEKAGFVVTDNFSVLINTTKGDRPFDADCVRASVFGIGYKDNQEESQAIRTKHMKGTGSEWATTPEQVIDPTYIMDNPSEFWLGRVVVGCAFREGDIGHIVGFGRSSIGEVLVTVKWASGEECDTHHGNIEL